jgi:CheY-like chemotaxis protein
VPIDDPCVILVPGVPRDRAATILVVDDEPSNRFVAERVLEGAGYDVRAASDAMGALRAIQARGAFSLYIIDVMMPAVRGTDLADRIRELDPDARILYFTASSHALFSPAGRALGTRDAFLQKPVSNRELLDAVSRLLQA